MPTRTIVGGLMNDPDDGGAWQKAFDYFGGELYGWLRHKGVEEDLAAEIIQQTFVAALHVIKATPETNREKLREKFRPWLFRVLANALADQWREARRQAKLAKALAEKKEAEIAEEAAAELDLSDRRLIYKLARENIKEEFQPDTWKCFELVSEMQLPLERVADQLDKSEDAVRKNDWRVRDALRAEVERLRALE
jgi:RNA polymerase sigma factor (sigma-70 family)